MSRSKVSATEIIQSARNGDLKKVKQIADKFRTQIDIEVGGETALRVAVANGHGDIIDFLVSRFADKTMIDKQGNTYLHTAVEKQIQSLKKMLSLKVDTEIQNSNDLTPLELAVNINFDEGVKALSKKGNKKILKQRSATVRCGTTLQPGDGDNYRMLKTICDICNNEIAIVKIAPCYHMMLCINCADIKECKACSKPITERMLLIGICHTLFLEKYKEMRKKIKDLEEKSQCSICMEKNIDGVMTPCGHGVCSECVKSLKECPVCKRNIEAFQKIYIN